MTGIFNYVSVKLDTHRGDILMIKDERTASLGNTFIVFWTRLHFGWWGGWATKILCALVGLTPQGLYVTGIWTWWRKRKAKVAAKKRQAGKSCDDLAKEERSSKLARINVDDYRKIPPFVPDFRES